jgi:multidrug efflux pump
VDLRLEQGASHRAVEEDVRKLENYLQKQPGIDNFVAYVGWGSPRFYLALDQQLPASNFAQVIILTQDIEAREKLREQLIKLFDEDFTDLQANIGRLENGPPVGYPVQFRVTGPDASVLRGLAQQVANVMGKNSHLDNINFDWSEMSKIVQLNIDQDKLRLLGISRRELTDFIAAALNGVEFSTLREGDESISIMARGDAFGRNHLGQLADLAIHLPSGASVPLAQIAKLEYTFEPGVIWRRDRMPTITVRGNVYGDIQAPTVTAQIDPQLDAVRTQLPPGYRLEVGGTVEESASGQQSVNVGMPVFLLVVFTVLMIQLQNISRVVMVVLTAPLGLIGVALFLLLFKQPFGFVAMLGTIALFGMIMRNSVILVDQIQQDIASGKEQWTAIVDSAVRRFRPIVLTAAAAVLAMIPLTQNTFFGPMAVAIMGGLIVATLLTLLFLPALYAAWYRVKAPTNVTVVD